MFKNIILCLLFFLIISYIIIETLTVSNKNNLVDIDKSVKYYNNDVNTNKVLSDRFKQSTSLEQEQVASMNIHFHNKSFQKSSTFQPILTSIEGTTNLSDI